ERPLASDADIEATLARAVEAQRRWRAVSVAERAAVCTRAVEWCVAHADELGAELTSQMGRAIAHSPFELRRGFQERGKYMAGIAAGVFQYLHVDHDQVAQMIADERIAFVAFTGSVAGGQAVQRAAADRFIGVGLELGGKDAAYVRADAALEQTIENVVDGAFFNAGQSCCSVRRVYVDRRIYGRFVDAAVAL